MNRQGFTLIELLVTMAIIGILMTVILNLQSSTIAFTAQQNGVAQRLQAINEVSGYIGDRVKAAQSVPDGLSVPASTGGSSTCSRSASAPCLAVVLPVVEPTCGQVINWALHAFHYVARSSVAATEKTPMAGLDSFAYGLRETRVASGSADKTCTDPMTTVPTAFTGTSTSGMVVDNLMLPAAGTPAFAYDAAKQAVTIQLRSVTVSQVGVTEYTPAAGPYELTVFARNVN